MTDTARLFASGNSQAVRLPKAFRFKGDKVYVKRVGNGVLLLPYKASWQSMLDGLGLFTDDFMQERAQPEGQERNLDFGQP